MTTDEILAELHRLRRIAIRNQESHSDLMSVQHYRDGVVEGVSQCITATMWAKFIEQREAEQCNKSES